MNELIAALTHAENREAALRVAFWAAPNQFACPMEKWACMARACGPWLRPRLERAQKRSALGYCATAHRLALVAPTAGDPAMSCRRESGIWLSRPWEAPRYEPSKRV